MLIQSPPTKAIPKELIYEMDDGKPIFYRGFQEVLKGNKTIDEIMSDSNLQAWLKGKVYLELSLALSKDYDVTVGEQGLTLAKKSWRAADVAIFRFDDLVLNKHYSKVPPVVALEIDLKIPFESPAKTIEYVENKNAKLLAFGVEKIIWIFTDKRKIAVVTTGGRVGKSQVYDWSDDMPVIDDVKLNMAGLFVKYRRSDLSGLL